jgi:hypothetical protein
MFKFDLLPNEKVLNIYRQSEVVLFRPAIIIMALIYFPWFFFVKYELADRFSRLLIFWTFLVLIYAVHSYMLWLVNIYLVSNRRLVHVSHKNLLNKKVSESPLDKIINVSFSIKGFWQSIFGFGNVEAQVLGLSEPIVFKNVSKPSAVKDFLWTVHAEIVGQTLKPADIINQPPVNKTKTSQTLKVKKMDL